MTDTQRLTRTGMAVAAVLCGLIAACARSASPSAAGAAGGVRPTDRLIVRTAELDAQVDKLEGVETRLTTAVTELGGFVTRSETSGTDDDARLVVTLRVPDARLDAALTTLESLASHVEHRRLSGEDVTAEDVDLDAQRENLAAARDRLLALLQRAATATEALDVNRALTEVQGQLEQVQGRLKLLRQSAAMATLVATFTERPATGFGSWRPLEVTRSALVALGVLARGMANVAIVSLVFVPVWGPVVLLLRRRQRLRAGA